MYLHGLKKLAEYDEYGNVDMGYGVTGQDLPASPPAEYGGVIAASSQPPTDNSDWTRIVSSAITTFGNFATAKLQSKTAIATAPYTNRYAYLPGSAGYLPGATPSPFAYTPALSGTTILVGAAAIAAFIFLRR